jgi:hypothetical protein
MKVLMIGFLCLINTIDSACQKVLLMERMGTSRKFFYHVNDEIRLKPRSGKMIYQGQITSISDSSVNVGNYMGREDKLVLSGIHFVYRTAYAPKRISQIFLIAGSAYYILDTFNNLITHEQVFDPQTMIISASLIGVSLVLMPLSQQRYTIGFKWKLKVLDFSF